MTFLSSLRYGPIEDIGPRRRKLECPGQERIFKAGKETADKLIEVNQVTEKGKLLEKAGRKTTGLKPSGHGSGVAEVSRSFGELGELHRRSDRFLRSREARERLTGNRDT